MSKKIGVILSGCGYLDGSEIHEAVLTLLAIDRCGAEAVCMAPNIEQTDVVNHLTGEASSEKRNALVEAARIARGNIKEVTAVSIEELDAIIVPGGYGAAKTLCDFAQKQSDCQVEPAVAQLLSQCLEAKKPLGMICIAPVVLAKVAGQTESAPTLTIGNDDGTKQAIEKMGAQHQDCVVTAIVKDETNQVVSTPAYMLANKISEAAEGIEKLVRSIVEMA